MRPLPVLNDDALPLVSITVHNYNYGPYLRECLDSLMAQTYPNIEICFSDNASTDDSWAIALEYARRYPGVMTITCNRTNFGPDANYANCSVNIRGKYLLIMCSDDTLMPQFVERCVQELEAHPDAGFAMVHRTIIDQDGTRISEAPFYNQSCLIQGKAQAAVYMMASVNPSISQTMYNWKKTWGKSGLGGLAARWYGNRILDFNICCEYPMVYIHDPLMCHRMHGRNDSYGVSDNLMEIIGPYVLQHQFAESAGLLGLNNVAERLPASIEKVGRTSLRYAARYLIAGNERLAKQYLHLAQALAPQVQDDAVCRQLASYWDLTPEAQADLLRSLQEASNLLTRSVSYEPPPGSVPLEAPCPASMDV